jgi:hypothetical protein
MIIGAVQVNDVEYYTDLSFDDWLAVALYYYPDAVFDEVSDSFYSTTFVVKQRDMGYDAFYQDNESAKYNCWVRVRK